MGRGAGVGETGISHGRVDGRDPDHSSVSIDLSRSACRQEIVFWWFHILNEVAKFESSVRALRHELKGKFMKKVKAVQDELRPEYRRQDFGTMTRGKYADRCRKASNVVVIAPELQKVFPNAQAVNDALRGLMVSAL